jgi:RNase P/RNase MRP subunit p30
MREKFDLFASPDALDFGRRLGWGGFCVAAEYGSGFGRFAGEARKLPGDVLVGALIAADAAKNARRALDAADLVLVDGRREDICREASETWEVDLIVNPELNEERDLIRQRSSGLDHVMAAFMAERDIGYLVNVDNILDSWGQKRTQLTGRIRQNIMLAKKYGVRVALSCGMADGWHMRNPGDMEVLGRFLGLGDSHARDSVSENALHFARKALSRNDPDTLMRGLTVKSWGHQERRSKAKYGWY